MVFVIFIDKVVCYLLLLKLLSYGGKFCYIVRYYIGNRSIDCFVKNIFRYFRSLCDVLNSRGFVVNYNIDDVCDEEICDIDVFGIDDLFLGDLDEVIFVFNMLFLNSCVIEVVVSFIFFFIEIDKEKFGLKVEF